MKSLRIVANHNSPDITLSSDDKNFIISGKSAPEDVRELFYPVVEWLTLFAEELKTRNPFTNESPLTFRIDLVYFNSSSAKFLYDIFRILKEIKQAGTPVVVEWYYDAEDTDLMEAGEDMAISSGLEFIYCAKDETES
ncbi:MAG: DUF1987 domain-containing protein [Bacteroidales bacterium]|nr:DUF1987 domain-containing protein [Bacteroidales bacterium]